MLPHSCIKDSTEKKRCPLEKSIAEKKMMNVVNCWVAIRSVRMHVHSDLRLRNTHIPPKSNRGVRHRCHCEIHHRRKC